MNTSSLFRTCRAAGAALVLAAGLSACSTGTDSGDTNVERGTDKQSLGLGATQSGADSSRMAKDTATSQQERLYEGASEQKDRDNDGKADQ